MLPVLINPELEPRDIESAVWTHGLVLAPYGSRVGIRATSARLLAEVRARMLPHWVEIGESEVDHLWSLTKSRIYFDSQPFAGSPVQALDHHFHLYMGVSAVGYTFIHAGAVVVGGQAILLPGASFAGKTTLTRALHRAGACIYSDDLAVIDGDGLVYPYPKPLSLRMPDGRVEEIPVPGWRADLPGAPVKVIASLRYEEDCSKMRLDCLPPGQASLLLIENSLSSPSKFIEDFHRIAKVCAGATAYRGVRSDSDRAAAELLQLL